jgi:hypothetical protein
VNLRRRSIVYRDVRGPGLTTRPPTSRPPLPTGRGAWQAPRGAAPPPGRWPGWGRHRPPPRDLSQFGRWSHTQCGSGNVIHPRTWTLTDPRGTQTIPREDRYSGGRSVARRAEPPPTRWDSWHG